MLLCANKKWSQHIHASHKCKPPTYAVVPVISPPPPQERKGTKQQDKPAIGPNEFSQRVTQNSNTPQLRVDSPFWRKRILSSMCSRAKGLPFAANKGDKGTLKRHRPMLIRSIQAQTFFPFFLVFFLLSVSLASLPHSLLPSRLRGGEPSPAQACEAVQRDGGLDARRSCPQLAALPREFLGQRKSLGCANLIPFRLMGASLSFDSKECIFVDWGEKVKVLLSFVVN